MVNLKSKPSQIFQLLSKRQLAVASAFLLIGYSISGCGDKEEANTSFSPEIPEMEIVCSLAPSQSDVVANVSSALGGASATAVALAQATGLSVVTHSSGALILTGTGGYIAGTLGGAISGPVIVGAGVIVAGSALTVELLCAPTNHPDEVAKVKAAANEFFHRSKLSFDGAKATVSQQSKKISATIQRITGDVYEYAFRR